MKPSMADNFYHTGNLISGICYNKNCNIYHSYRHLLLVFSKFNMFIFCNILFLHQCAIHCGHQLLRARYTLKVFLAQGNCIVRQRKHRNINHQLNYFITNIPAWNLFSALSSAGITWKKREKTTYWNSSYLHIFYQNILNIWKYLPIHCKFVL